MGSSPLEELVAEFGIDSEEPPTSPISRERVLECMQSGDLEVLGATYWLVCGGKLSQRIEPPLSFAECHPFMIKFYDRCFRENPVGEWTRSRYGAGMDLLGYFVGLWEDARYPRETLTEIKDWLAALYKEGDQDLRVCVVTATLEHLFEEEPFREFFADWKDDPVLKEAHAQAMQWTLGGGRTLPLMRAFRRLDS